jgi:hypothetical protein
VRIGSSRAGGRSCRDVRARIIETEETALLQEAGIYEYRHRLADAVAYKEDLDVLKTTLKDMVREGTAIRAAKDWSVNGSKREGQKMVRDFSKLMLRAYNAEADNCVRTVRPHSRPAAVARLATTRATITRLGATMPRPARRRTGRLRVCRPPASRLRLCRA